MKSLRITVSIILGLVFVYIGYVYATHGAQNLPTYFPGYAAGVARVHSKHSIASFVVAAALFIYAWFESGSRSTNA